MNIRDGHRNLVEVEKHHWVVSTSADVRARLVELVREHCPDAETADIAWHNDPDAPGAGGEAWWTTAAEVDGVLRGVEGTLPN